MKKPIATKFHEGSRQLVFILKLYDECSINLHYKFSAFGRFTRVTYLFILRYIFFFLIVDISVHQNLYQNTCPDPIR